MSASSTSSSSSGLNILADVGQLLQRLEIGAGLITVLFAMYDIDESISVQEKNKAQESWFQWAVSSWAFRSESGTAAGEERFIQDHAQKLYSALDGVSRSLPSQTELGFGIEDFRVDKSLLCTLALGVMEQAAADDHKAALAMENGRNLPAVTQCQKVVQGKRFFRLLEEGFKEDDPESKTQRFQHVINTLVKQSDIDVNREGFAWKNGRNVLDKTHCQLLLEHREFQALFGGMKKSYYKSIRPTAKCSTTVDYIDWFSGISLGMGKGKERVECVGCCDAFLVPECLEAACGHFFCEGCIVTLVGICIKDESSFPMKCCKQAINSADVTLFLDDNLQRLFAAACLEFGTPSQNRIYCPQPTCSKFLGSAASYRQGQTVTCKACNISICVTCRERGHPGDNCEQNQQMEKVRQLAKEKKWGTCPECKAVIERTEGCNHMVCRCTKEFCYKCGVPWRPRTCSC